jgi:hypothetical protein
MIDNQNEQFDTFDDSQTNESLTQDFDIFADDMQVSSPNFSDQSVLGEDEHISGLEKSGFDLVYDKVQESMSGASGDASTITLEQVMLARNAPQEYAYEQSMAGQNLTELAVAQGWFIPGGGTPLHCTGNLLEANGWDVERNHGATLDDLSEHLRSGENVLIAVNTQELWSAKNDFQEQQSLSEVPGIPGQEQSHMVEVIGIDKTSSSMPVVSVQDPAHPGETRLEIPAEKLLDAWEGSDYFALYVARQSPSTTEPELAGEGVSPTEVQEDQHGQQAYPTMHESQEVSFRGVGGHMWARVARSFDAEDAMDEATQSGWVQKFVNVLPAKSHERIDEAVGSTVSTTTAQAEYAKAATYPASFRRLLNEDDPFVGEPT